MDYGGGCPLPVWLRPDARCKSPILKWNRSATAISSSLSSYAFIDAMRLSPTAVLFVCRNEDSRDLRLTLLSPDFCFDIQSAIIDSLLALSRRSFHIILLTKFSGDVGVRHIRRLQRPALSHVMTDYCPAIAKQKRTSKPLQNHMAPSPRLLVPRS